MQVGAAGVGDYFFADHDCVAGEGAGFFLFYFDEVGHGFAEGALAVVVEGAGVVDGFAVRERAEASVEVVVVPVDHFERDHADAEEFGDLLMAAGVAAGLIAGEERVAAEEGVAGAFEVGSGRRFADFVTEFHERGLVEGLFALALVVFEMGEDSPGAEEHGGVGGEDEVRQAGDRRDEFDFCACGFDVGTQVFPLLDCEFAIGGAGAAHPGVDFVLDTVVVGRAHEDAGGHEENSRRLRSGLRELQFIWRAPRLRRILGVRFLGP